MLSSICFMPASLMPQSLPPGSPTMAWYLSDSMVVTCMPAALYQTKNGLPVFFGSLRSEEVDHLGGDLLVHRLRAVSRQRSLVTARLVLLRAVGRPAPQHVARGRQTNGGLRIDGARHFSDTGYRRVLARRRHGLRRRIFVDVGEAHALHGIKMVEVTPVFLKPVRRRQGRGVVAQVVLAELAGRVAEVAQEYCERRCARLQIGRAARKLGRDHAR